MQISGSVRLSNVSIKTSKAAPEPVFAAATFVWSVSSPELGRHRVGEQFATTLSATFNGERVCDYTLLTGRLPPTIVLAPTSGILTGTLTSPGYFVFTLRARVQNAVSDASYRLTIE